MLQPNILTRSRQTVSWVLKIKNIHLGPSISIILFPISLFFKACHESCEENCTGGGPKACQACKGGYEMTDTEGCKGSIYSYIPRWDVKQQKGKFGGNDVVWWNAWSQWSEYWRRFGDEAKSMVLARWTCHRVYMTTTSWKVLYFWKRSVFILQIKMSALKVLHVKMENTVATRLAHMNALVCDTTWSRICSSRHDKSFIFVPSVKFSVISTHSM